MRDAIQQEQEWIEANRRAWNASAPLHAKGPGWERLVQGFKSEGFSVLDSTVTGLLREAGVNGGRVVQIGCNNGRELLSCFSLGAKEGLGIDQSEAFLAQAVTLNALRRANCHFLRADVNRLPADTQGDFDVALITIGVLNWMPDLGRFFRVVASLLRPGGRLVVYETHPVLEMFDTESPTPFVPVCSYFGREPQVLDEAIVYDDRDAGPAPVSYWFSHGMADILNACVVAGLRIDRLNEYPHNNREAAYEMYVGRQAQLPLCFGLRATRELTGAA